ncbi:P-loop containing nucleoside triphosphate hydrolase protein [Thelephora ganbajun]|uniref:P-loop containing nucleoside triphosphate hydrolase protein n=1 Tax=Thelephora ganbajun TaxID=370292 RepID=A0ACB6ZXP6_THEGA|nr:P-loop containing nucleoside triphosphate hydrolase protein [Thelephora ganbajun]
MAKKKKALKPLARGFATVSVPKKPIPTEQSQITEDVGDTSRMQSSDLPTASVAPPQPDPVVLEESALQAIVEKFQDKTEKDIVRSVKAVEQERRFAQTLPLLNLDPVITDRILELALEGEKIEDRKLGEDNEEKVLSRLGITYGILRRLGFTEERVEECLRAINGVELEEAFNWLHLHCTEEEIGQSLYPGEVGEPGTPRSSGTWLSTPTAVSTPSHTPQTPRTPVRRQRSLSPLSTRTPSRAPSRLDVNAPVLAPLFARGPSQLREEVQLGKLDAYALEPGVVTLDAGGIYVGDDPDAEYVRLKLEMDVLRKENNDPGSVEQLRLLQTQLDDVKQSYFFREKASEAQYRLERQRLDSEALKVKLRGLPNLSFVPSTPPEFVSQSKHQSLDLKPTGATKPNANIFDDDSDSESHGGLFEILQEIPATETTASGSTVRLQSMEVPKHWSGRLPKVSLQETITKKDKYAVVSYACISGPSRVRRASVAICWDGGRTQSWGMNDVGCPDLKQAEQYISTIALHALTFPTLEGFVLGGTSAANTQTFFRLLPPVFRNLWDELEEKRRESDDAANRTAWAKLRTIARMKLESQSKSTGKSSKTTGGGKDERPTRNISSSHELSEEQIRAGFEARRASPAYQQMLQERNRLPIARYRTEIVEALEMSQALVLSGETGCGKSTQVPSFILEDQLSQGKHCMIYCTEPRRISAISLAQRVSRELGDLPGAIGTPSSLVGYSIRLESNTSRNTRLTFVTNGIALRMLESGTGQGGQGTAFDEITHIVIDEVHERSIESDFLLIVLKSLILERPDLKIILMSATVDAEKISEYFGGCPTLRVPGRTFPVDVRYLEDALETTKWWISESSPYASYDRFHRGKNRPEWTEDNAAAEDDDGEDAVVQDVKLEKRYSAKTAATINLLDERQIPYDLILRLLECICFEDDVHRKHSAAILIFMPGMSEIRRMNDMLAEHRRFGSEDEFVIHALHSTVSSENQGAVFDVPPRGIRKIVIATNIAETGITIPDITCVIDSGKHREMRFDEKRQMSRLVETYIAKSNAAQRRGRAGRVQDGLCFHLFTKLRHDTTMADHPLPEMTRLSLSDLALRIKTMKVNLGPTIEDVLTCALDPPSATNIRRAVSTLVEVRALTPTEDITPLGSLLSKLPTDVHLGKFLLIATTFRCLDPALTIAATLSSKSPFLIPFGSEDAADLAKSRFKVKSSDFLTIHNAFDGWRKASANSAEFARSYCQKNFLSYQNLQTIEELRQQFLGYLIDSSFIHVEREYIRELGRTRWGRNRTRFLPVPPEYDSNSGNHFLLHAALAAGLYPKILAIDPIDRKSIKTVPNGQVCHFHPSSANSKGFPDFRGNHMVYFTLMHSKKLYAWETGPVDDLALVLLCGECEFKLISNSAFIDRKIKFRILGRVNIALKYLRHHLAAILANQIRGKPLSESQMLWHELAMSVLGKSKLITGEEENQGGIGQIIVG